MDNPSKRQKLETGRTTIAIIGSAGRGLDVNKITKELWSKMINKAEEIIVKEWGLEWKNVRLVSGGAAFSDHVAVELFLKHPDDVALTLELPSAWDARNKQFIDTKVRDWKANPGGTSNCKRLFLF